MKVERKWNIEKSYPHCLINIQQEIVNLMKEFLRKKILITLMSKIIILKIHSSILKINLIKNNKKKIKMLMTFMIRNNSQTKYKKKI